MKELISIHPFSETGDFDISVKTMFNLEEILLRELEILGAKNIEAATRIVHCRGDFEFLCKANLHLRTALRVLVPVVSFTAKNPEEMYEIASLVEWEKYLTHEMSFAIDPVVHSARFPHSHFAALKLKDAIVDYFKKKSGSRPDVDVIDPMVRFNLHIDDDEINISLDSSGRSLNQRGYRISGARAPINEVLAAGMVMLSGWNKELPLYDPMCGSGTIAIEAALLACNIAPGLIQPHFGFMRWKEFNDEQWQVLVRKAKAAIDKTGVKIFASDVVPAHITVATQNLGRAGVKDVVQIKQADFFKLQPEFPEGSIIMNPPYGERLDDGDMLTFYKQIGTSLKHSWSGHTAWIISSNLEAMKEIGLKPARKHKLLNGTLECVFNGYELFKGTRKDHVVSSLK